MKKKYVLEGDWEIVGDSARIAGEKKSTFSREIGRFLDSRRFQEILVDSREKGKDKKKEDSREKGDSGREILVDLVDFRREI